MSDALAKVNACYGMAETFWDIGFTDLQMAYADAEDEFQCTISVHVDGDTGAVTLNNGYAPGSTRYDQEERLFAEFRHSIIEALTSAVPDDAPEYRAFLDRAAGDREYRLERIEEIEERLEEEQERCDA